MNAADVRAVPARTAESVATLAPRRPAVKPIGPAHEGQRASAD